MDYTGETEQGDLVICRRNAPLLSLCYELISDGVKAIVRGRDIGAGLAKIVKTVSKGIKGEWIDAFADRLDIYGTQQREQIKARYRDEDAAATAIEGIDDKLQCVRIVLARSKARSSVELCNAIDSLFSDKIGAVTLSSVHRAKGLEADRVVILEHDRLMSTRARQQWQIEQEEHLAYVAYTRAKHDLVLIPAPKREK